MSEDINLIVDVEPGEAKALIELIEVLFKETYIARKNRQESIKKVRAATQAAKDREKKPVDGQHSE